MVYHSSMKLLQGRNSMLSFFMCTLRIRRVTFQSIEKEPYPFTYLKKSVYHLSPWRRSQWYVVANENMVDRAVVTLQWLLVCIINSTSYCTTHFYMVPQVLKSFIDEKMTNRDIDNFHALFPIFYVLNKYIWFECGMNYAWWNHKKRVFSLYIWVSCECSYIQIFEFSEFGVPNSMWSWTFHIRINN